MSRGHGRSALGPFILMLVLLTGACAGSRTPASADGRSESPVVSPAPTTTPTATASPVARPSATLEPTPTPLTLLDPFPSGELSGATVERLQAVLDAAATAGAPAILAAVATTDGSWSGAAGVVGAEEQAAAPDDVFAIASVTKIVLAALMLRLEELDMVDLDAPLSAYLGDLDVDTNGATVRQALAMRAGFGETAGSVVDEALSDCSRAWSRADVLAAFPAPIGKPGAQFGYSNPGYKLVGYVAEEVTGLSLAAAMRQYVLDPVGVDRLVLQSAEADTPRPWALPIEGHGGPLALEDYGVGGTLPCLADTTLSVGGTAMASDARDLARWTWSLFSGEVVGADSLAAMTMIDADSYGLGVWRFYDFGPDVAYGHAGNKPGYSPLVAVLPERQIVVVVCITDQHADPYRPARELLEALSAS